SFLGKWGSSGAGKGQFRCPWGMDFSRDGAYLYVSDCNNARVQYFTPTGSFVGAFGTPGNGEGQFIWPQDVAFSPSGDRLYVADSRNHRIQYFRWSAPAVSPASLGRVKAIFR
ncbi:MAG: NHL repeat-containing protein, partial [bacterium]